MQTKTKFILFIAIVVVVVFSFGLYFGMSPQKPSKLDDFAKCINNSGAKFYNAFWCSHCQNQKKMFGSSAKYLPSIECSNPDGQSQVESCKEAGIDAYPTWEFAGGERVTGELQLATLSEKTQCVLPQ